MNIAIISATWHADLLEIASRSCTEALGKDVATAAFTVPGALEIPLMAQTLAKTGRHDGIIAIGLIVDGGIYRHEFVADAVISGMMRVQLDTGVPIFSCVLTPQHFDESEERISFFRGHLAHKGREVGNACRRMLDVLASVRSQAPL